MSLPTLLGASLAGDALSVAAALAVFAVLLLLLEGLDRV